MMCHAQSKGWCRAARYLGPTLNDRQSFCDERRNRFVAAIRNWQAYRSFWTSSTPWPVRRIVFCSLVSSALLSACETFTLSKYDYIAFDRFLVRKLRVMMKGKACTKESYEVDGQAKVRYKMLSNVHVFQSCRVLPSFVEVPMSRLKMLQRWLLDTNINQWILTSFSLRAFNSRSHLFLFP